MKIVFMGTPDLAAEVLDTMMKSGCEVTLAVTQPDRPKGRGRGVIRTPVHECADKWGIPVFSPERVKRPEAVQRRPSARSSARRSWICPDTDASMFTPLFCQNTEAPRRSSGR